MSNDVKLTTEKKSPLDFLKRIFRRRASLDARKARAGYVFVLPFLLGVALIYLPILIDSLWFSFSQISATSDGTGRLNIVPVGFDNYARPFSTPGFTEALLAGLQQLLFEVPAIIVFSLFIAVVLNQKMLGRAMFRAIFFVPVIISTGIMMDFSAGGENDMSGAVGGETNSGTGEGGASEIISVLDVQQLFASMKIGGELVTYVVGIVNNVYNIINYSGVQMLIFLAGLQSISPSIYEACRIDGATGWETFWKITFPMISPMILVNAVYTVIDSFTRTNNPAMQFIQNAFGLEPEMSTAMYWMYFLIIALIIVIVAGIASSFVFYQRKD